MESALNTLFIIGAIIVVVWLVHDLGKRKGKYDEQDRPHREKWGLY